jgi:hypothetical protein
VLDLRRIDGMCKKNENSKDKKAKTYENIGQKNSPIIPKIYLNGKEI